MCPKGGQMRDNHDPRASIGRPSDFKLSVNVILNRQIPQVYVNEPWGLDASSYQGIIDCYAPNWSSIDFVYLRGGISWGTKDARFDFNWSESRRRGKRRGAYFVLYPGEDPVKQVNFWLSILDGDMGELPPGLDLELHNNQTRERISYAAEKCMDLLSSAYGSPCIVYSAAWFINAYVGSQSWYNKYWWWLANYLYANPLTGYAEEHPGPVVLPLGVSLERTLIHQTAGKYNADGFGVQSKNIDTDRWIKGLAHLVKFAKSVSLSSEEILSRLTVAHKELFPELFNV